MEENKYIAFIITQSGELRFRSTTKMSYLRHKGFLYKDGNVENCCLAEDFPKCLKGAQDFMLKDLQNQKKALKKKIKAIKNIIID
jgi:hypothetical protein